ncbi:A24 family peptidase [Arthrobacter sp. H20]|uniref:prepilin peptidase n=1 Tax=Arthrobacter sp. H20 TaxID=1267981 RepID=UPI0004B2A21B|nr:A24 family peptidase [Arthrobacter sp. H20]
MTKTASGLILALPQSAKILSTAATALFSAVVIWRFGWSPETPAFLLLPIFGVVLAVIDLRSRQLPNVLVLPFALTGSVLLTAASALSGDWGRLAGGAIGSAAMFALYLVLALISPGSLGMGDVKLAAVLGLYGGYAGMTAWMATILGGFVLGGVISLSLLVFTRASARSVFPFGPPMIVACFAALVWFG